MGRLANQKSTSISYGLLALSVALTSHFVVANEKLSSYEKYHTQLAVEHSPSGSTYTVDPHVWVYTSEFAKRWGMPKKWIDDSLQGAEAIAYKVANEGYVTCGYFRDPEACIPNQSCIYDFYISKDANLPWQDNRLQGYRSSFNYNSPHFLTVEDPTDYVNYNDKFLWKRNWYGSRVAFDNVYYAVDLDPIKKEARTYNIASVRQYDRERFVHVDYISVGYGCIFTKDTARGQGEFVISEPSVVNGKATDYYKMKGSQIPVRHRAILPKEFAKRVRLHHQKHYGNHLWNAVKDNLKLN